MSGRIKSYFEPKKRDLSDKSNNEEKRKKARERERERKREREREREREQLIFIVK